MFRCPLSVHAIVAALAVVTVTAQITDTMTYPGECVFITTPEPIQDDHEVCRPHAARS